VFRRVLLDEPLDSGTAERIEPISGLGYALGHQMPIDVERHGRVFMAGDPLKELDVGALRVVVGNGRRIPRT
jgi:hypothetical protein